MKQCTVEFVGKDDKLHSAEIEASSLFNAVEQMVAQWARLWEYDPHADFVVRVEGVTYRVPRQSWNKWYAGNRADVLRKSLLG